MPHTIVITGANRGLGLELARQLSTRPNTLIIGTARNPSKANALAALPNTRVVALDASSTASTISFAQEVAKIAPEGIDELWNNSAQNSVHYDPSKVPGDELLAELRINVVGPIEVTQQLLPQLRKKAGGAKKVWFMSSIMGSSSFIAGTEFKETETSLKFSKGLAYTVAKAALTMVAVNFWGELKNEGFTVSPIHPGWVQTEMGGKHAALTPEVSIEGVIRTTDELAQTEPVRLRDYKGDVLED